MGLSHGPLLKRWSMGSLSRSAHGLFYLCVQAEEGRRAPEAKVTIIKEAILFFSGHHPFHFSHKISILVTLFTHKSQQKNCACLRPGFASMDRIVVYTEGRVSEPLACGDHSILRNTLVCIKNQRLVRVWDSFLRSPKRWPP